MSNEVQPELKNAFSLTLSEDDTYTMELSVSQL